MDREKVDALLTEMVHSADGVSDLFFVAGRPAQVEAFGKLKPHVADGPILSPEKTAALSQYLLNGNERLRDSLAGDGSCDCSYAIEGLARFRVNIYRQNGSHAIVMRKLTSSVPTLSQLSMPPIFNEMIKVKNGIIFVTGATGSGKTTTLAAMLNEINESQPIHVVTLEDPIEFMHQHKMATFSQRELGRDFYTFSGGLRAALRQAPKVILVGEIRDRDTMEIALTAAETGHVVFSTLHTINAGQTINRILGMFTKDEELQVRQRLAETLRFIVSQRLLPKASGGRVMVNEIMGTNLRVRETVLYGENDNRSYAEIIESQYPFGWHSFDQALCDEYAKGSITEETVTLHATSKPKVSQALAVVKQKMGVPENENGSFKLRMEGLREESAMPPPLPTPVASASNGSPFGPRAAAAAVPQKAAP